MSALDIVKSYMLWGLAVVCAFCVQIALVVCIYVFTGAPDIGVVVDRRDLAVGALFGTASLFGVCFLWIKSLRRAGARFF